MAEKSGKLCSLLNETLAEAIGLADQFDDVGMVSDAIQ